MYIHQHHVIRLPPQRPENFQAVGGHIGTVAQPLQEGQGHLLIDRIVLCQQDAQGQPLPHLRVELGFSLHVGPLDGPCLLSKETHQHVVQLRGFDGLGQKGRQLDPFRVGFSLPRSQHDQGQCLRIALPPYLGRQHQAVHLRHLHIQDGHVKGVAPANPVQRLGG